MTSCSMGFIVNLCFLWNLFFYNNKGLKIVLKINQQLMNLTVLYPHQQLQCQSNFLWYKCKVCSMVAIVALLVSVHPYLGVLVNCIGVTKSSSYPLSDPSK